MDSEFTLYSIMDLNPCTLPIELLFGKLRSTTEFSTLETLGEGSSAVVVKAQDNIEKKVVAMKILKPIQGNANNEKLRKDIFREINALKCLDHDNVIKLHHVAIGTDINSLCLILDYCNIALSGYIDRYPKPIIPHNQIKCIAKHMFKGLDYLHKNYIVHRDLNPSNLMITPEGVLKIADFGMSRRIVYQQRRKWTRDVITLWYRPLEVLLKAPTYGHQVDLWSAGCILMELFQKSPFFRGEGEINQIVKIISVLGTPTPNIWPDITKCEAVKMINLPSQQTNNLVDKVRELGCSPALEILSGLFKLNPNERMGAEKCLEHDWFYQSPPASQSIQLPKPPIKQVIMPSIVAGALLAPPSSSSSGR